MNPANSRKHHYYLEIAEAVGKKSTCLRRKYGAIIVKNDQIIATGYNGSPRSCTNCNERGYCLRELLGVTKGDSYNLCTSVHAEQNCIIAANRMDMIGAAMYIVGINVDIDGDLYPKYADPSPCMICHRMIINAGITEAYGYINSLDNPEIITLDVSVAKFESKINHIFTRTIEELQESDPDKAYKAMSIMKNHKEPVM